MGREGRRSRPKEKGYTLKMDSGLHEALRVEAEKRDMSMRGLMLSYLQNGLSASQRVFPLGKFEAALKSEGVDNQFLERVVSRMLSE